MTAADAPATIRGLLLRVYHLPDVYLSQEKSIYQTSRHVADCDLHKTQSGILYSMNDRDLFYHLSETLSPSTIMHDTASIQDLFFHLFLRTASLFDVTEKEGPAQASWHPLTLLIVLYGIIVTKSIFLLW